MRFFRIRKADIPAAERAVFERYGVNVIGMVLAGGYSPGAQEISGVYERHNPMQVHARDWMTEQFDKAERHESWSILMEAAITIFVLAELIISITGLISHRH